MKVAAISKEIKNGGYCHLYRVHGPEDTETSMFIGTSSEIYSLEGFPKPWTEAELVTMLGIDQKKWDNVIYKEHLCESTADLGGMSMEDTDQSEVECRKSYINLYFGGTVMMGLIDEDKKEVGFVALRAIAPLMDEIKKSDYINYCQRRTANGTRYYVVKDGMMVRGAFLPVQLSGGTLESLKMLVRMAEKTALMDKAEE